MTFSVLMYHSLYLNDSDLELIPPEEKPYSIKVQQFQEQLNILERNNINVIDPEDFLNLKFSDSNENSVLLTFDDGHSSFYKYAYPELQGHNFRAIFFVTSDLIKYRDDFCSWAELKEMHEHGMKIESHGKTHKFISDLNDTESIHELTESLNEIEKNIENSVRSISFPGGRYSARECVAAKKVGYKYLFTSVEGLNNYKNCTTTGLVKRFALKNTTSLSHFTDLSVGNSYTIKKRILINVLKVLVKKIIGNKIYHSLYQRRRDS